MTHSLTTIYKKHHGENRSRSFSLWKHERSSLIDFYLGDRKNILDLGCRDGALVSAYKGDRSITGFDIDSSALSYAEEHYGITTQVVDLNGPWHESVGHTYEGVVMAETLEHLYFPKTVLEKIKTVLGSGGILVGSVPNAFSLRHRLRYLVGQKKCTPLSDPTHINQFTYGELKAVLESEFQHVRIIPLVRKPLQGIARIFPSLFAHSLFFVASDAPLS